jgi:hypothetical protein
VKSNELKLNQSRGIENESTVDKFERNIFVTNYHRIHPRYFFNKIFLIDEKEWPCLVKQLLYSNYSNSVKKSAFFNINENFKKLNWNM